MHVIAKLVSDPDIRHFLWADESVTREEIASMINKQSDDRTASDLRMWIIENGAGVPVGIIGYRNGYSGAELLIGLAAESRSRGLGTEACHAVVKYGFGSGLFHLMVARVNGANRAAIRLVQKIGMQFDGTSLTGDSITLHYSTSKE